MDNMYIKLYVVLPVEHRNLYPSASFFCMVGRTFMNPRGITVAILHNVVHFISDTWLF